MASSASELARSMPRPTRRRSGGRGFRVLRTDPPPPTEPHRAAGDPVGSAGGTHPLHGQGRRARCRRRGAVEGRHPCVLRVTGRVQTERLPACGERRRVHRPAEPVSPPGHPRCQGASRTGRSARLRTLRRSLAGTTSFDEEPDINRSTIQADAMQRFKALGVSYGRPRSIYRSCLTDYPGKTCAPMTHGTSTGKRQGGASTSGRWRRTHRGRCRGQSGPGPGRRPRRRRSRCGV